MKRCSKCGEVKPKSCFGPRSENPNWLRSSCKSCRSTHERGNEDLRRAAVRRYQQRNPELTLSRLETWKRNNPAKHRAIRQRINRKQVEVISDSYVRKVLCSHQYELSSADIPESLIEAKRVQLQIHRLLKEIKK